MKATDYSNLTEKEIREKIAEERAALSQMKFNHGVAGTENPMTIRNKRRDIARMLTALNVKNNNSK
jgi:large subunit ribosomal protein L29